MPFTWRTPENPRDTVEVIAFKEEEDGVGPVWWTDIDNGGPFPVKPRPVATVDGEVDFMGEPAIAWFPRETAQEMAGRFAARFVEV